MDRIIGPLKSILFFVVISLGLLSLARLGLVMWQWQRVASVDGLPFILLQGVRMDIVSLSWMLMLPTVFTILLPNVPSIQKYWGNILAFLLCSFLIVFLFMEMVTPFYINEYGTRPSRLFLEYLIYPREVLTMLWTLFKYQFLIGVGILAAASYPLFRLFQRSGQNRPIWLWWQRLCVLPLVLIILIIGARSSFSHRPVNMSSVAFSNDVLMNQLPLNSSYSVLYALLGMRNEADSSKIYGTMPEEEVIRRVKNDTLLDPHSFSNHDIPTLHQQTPSQVTHQPYNVVIILEESLGAQFVASLGGKALTPELEKLKAHGIWFTNMYATGTRSVRGIEAVTAGFPPTPARSVVKLGLSQHNFYTIAQTFKQKGYLTEFIYGGDSHFDNMAGFFLGNGFTHMVDENSYQHPVFHGTWGVSDEDMFDCVHKRLMQHANKPFFTLAFTTSFHSPFEFPAGRVDEHIDNDRSYAAVRYTDYALGQFFNKAMKSAYWKNTIFLVIADHDQRVFGGKLIPLEHFHIPALLLGGPIKPTVFTATASQIDMPPTLLSLAGIKNENPMLGRDLSAVSAQYLGRAIMQYENYHGYYQDGMLLVHSPKLPPRQFLYQDNKLIPVPVNDELAKDALAHALWASLVYRQQKYRTVVEN